MSTFGVLTLLAQYGILELEDKEELNLMFLWQGGDRSQLCSAKLF
jgi:hypothetical protein